MVHTGWAAIDDFSTLDERGLGTCGAGVLIAFCRPTKIWQSKTLFLGCFLVRVRLLWAFSTAANPGVWSLADMF